MSTDQEYWDAILIRTWRQFGTVRDAVVMFNATVGRQATECDLLRFPNPGAPWSMGVRVFVAEFLPKISTWLWEHPPEQDVNLLRGLKDSKYTTLTCAIEKGGKELNDVRRAVSADHKRMLVGHAAYLNRNDATDWNKTKGAVKSRRAR